MRHSVSYTTRSPRPGDVNGVDYWFVDDGTFDRMIDEKEFLEYALVHGKRYGTSKKDLEEMLDAGLNVILEIDVQGARHLRELLDGGVYIFVLPPSVEACRQRLSARGKDSDEEIEKRLNVALGEIKEASFYDYIIFNDDVEAAFENLASIIRAEMCRKERLMERVEELFGRG
ncbi:MAG: guanylate kinase [Thermodesulfobacteriota bacterium]|nr:MAG: guanylate kinase [Thermodesulfobacteriota bacterium]